MRRRWRMGAAGIALALGACGGDGVTPPTPAPTTPPVPCTQTTLFSNSGPVPALVLLVGDLAVPESGRLDITLDWTFATSLMGVYVVPGGTCTLAEFNARTCNFLVRSDPPGPKPRTVSTPNFQAGNYRFMLANYSDVDESAALQVLLSRGGCTPAAGALSAHSGERAEALRVRAVGRLQR